jgi:hypothetical protein
MGVEREFKIAIEVTSNMKSNVQSKWTRKLSRSEFEVKANVTSKLIWKLNRSDIESAHEVNSKIESKWIRKWI